MLKDLLTPLCTELSLPIPPLENETQCSLSINDDTKIFFRSDNEKLFLKCSLIPCPLQNRETLFLNLMKANLLGESTGGGVIGLDEEEKFLTLSIILPYELDYQAFRESVEDFVNFVVYWRKEIERVSKSVS